ncbi:ACP S-malonyltransferase [Paenibacillus sp. SC116]|uniref:ACP S-malonyltransferase n=1 Tax=Paenibacillus sp. SC116 TaxID=2968986 RepID=UPI00215A870C|nr:ACP S-malonyltransferase [Paenibacillus sp. SC116]MCR8843451.1 ACP S-malonyltransferase [Paenibacillus sp. SC116]
MVQVAFVFPGQGSQYVGMGKHLLDSFSEAKYLFEEAGDTLGFDLKKLCLQGSLNDLTRTMNAQPAILTVSMIAYRYYMSRIGISPTVAAGHSLGEYTALVTTGALSFQDGLRIVRQRGLFMEEAAHSGIGKMIAIKGLSKERVEQICEGLTSDHMPISVACYNTPNQIVVAGHHQVVTMLTNALDRYGASYTHLNVSGPFHSALMQPAAEKLGAVLSHYSFHELKWPVISNVTACPYPGVGNIADGLLLQMICPVRWEPTIRYIAQRNIKAVVELGPRTVLSKMVKEIAAKLETYSVEQEQHITNLKIRLSSTNGMDLLKQYLSAAVSTRNRNDNEQQYEMGVLTPIRQLRQWQAGLELRGEQPTLEQLKEAGKLLEHVLRSKGASAEEIQSELQAIAQALEHARITQAI